MPEYNPFLKNNYLDLPSESGFNMEEEARKKLEEKLALVKSTPTKKSPVVQPDPTKELTPEEEEDLYSKTLENTSPLKNIPEAPENVFELPPAPVVKQEPQVETTQEAQAELTPEEKKKQLYSKILDDYTKLINNEKDPELAEIKKRQYIDRMSQAGARAANKMLQGYAMMGGGKIDANEDAVKAMTGASDAEMEAYLKNKEQRANQLQKVLSDLSVAEKIKSGRYQTKNIFDKKSGTIKTYLFDTSTGEMIETENIAGYAPSTLKSSYTGEDLILDKGMGKTRVLNTSGGSYVPQVEGQTGIQPEIQNQPESKEDIKLPKNVEIDKSSFSDNKQAEKFKTLLEKEISTPFEFKKLDYNVPEETPAFNKLTPEPRKRLIDISDAHKTANKDKYAALNDIKNLYTRQIPNAVKNKASWAQVGAQIAKLYEDGRLTDDDVKRYVRDQSLVGMIRQKIKTLASGTLTDEMAKELQSSMKLYNSIIQESVALSTLRAAKTLQQQGAANIPLDELAVGIDGGFKYPTRIKKTIDFIKQNPNDPKSKKYYNILSAEGWL